jgi:gliding motility-associated-like protein
MHIRNFIRLQCILLALILSWQVASAATYYISSTEGDDTRTAAEAQNAATPWKTLSKLSAITLQPGDQVLLKRGDDFRETYTVKRSGTSGNPIIFSAYGAGTDYPKVKGSNLITGWTPSSFNPSVYYAQVTYAVKDFFANGKRQTSARFPNTGWLKVDAMNGKTGLTDAALTQGSGYFNNAKVRIRTRDWAYEVRTIATYTSGQITFNRAIKYESGKDFSYYIDGLLSLLDAPGEWYYDAAQGRVYYWPEAGGSPADLKIEGQDRDAGINVDWGQSFVTIQQLEFAHHNKSISVPNNNNTVEIKNCYFHDITSTAIGHGGINGRIESNLIVDCLHRGVQAFADNFVMRENDIKNIGIVPGYGVTDELNGEWSAIALSASGKDVKVSYNRIDKVGYLGMEVGGLNMLVEKNLVQNCLYTLNDGSAISIPFAGSDMTFRNNFMLYSVGSVETKAANSANNDTNKPLGHGFYFGGNNNQRILLQGNTMAYNTGAGIAAIETYTSTIENNVVFDNLEGISFLDMTDFGANHQNNIKNNVFYSLAENHPIIYSLQFPGGNQQHNYGTFSNNYYFNPYSNLAFHFQYNPSGWSYNYYSPSAFRNATGGDPGGKASFLSLSPYVTSCNPAGAGTDLIVNGNFNSALAPWVGGGGCGANIAEYSSHPLLSGGAGSIRNDNCFGAPIMQNGLNIVANQFYKLTFSCASNTVSALQVSLSKQDWTNIGMKDAELFISEPLKNTYTYIFKATTTEPNGRLIFANKKPGTKIWIDDISLVPVEVTYDDPKERSQLFINPSDNPKTIALSANYWDIDQNEVSGSLTLAPWTSKILIKKDNAPCGVNQLPTVSLTAPVEGTSFASGGTLNLTATANDLDGQVVKVEFFQGNVKLGESTTAPYSFAWVNPPAGNYQISARATDDKGGTKVSSLVSITVTGAVTPTYTITFTVKDATNALVPGASVTFKGQTVVSNASGVATFANIAAGTGLAYTVKKTGYNDASSTVNVSANVAQNVVLTAVGTPTYTVTFTVKDAANALVSGASVTFKGQTVASNASGVATFSNIPAGTGLAYTVKKTGYNDASSTVNVSANVAQSVVLTAAPTYTVTFTVKDATEALVSAASVTFRGQTLTSNASGVATFTSISAGTSLAYDVKKTGYNTASGTVTVAANVAQNVVLTAVGSPTYSVSFTIKDDSEALLADALVSFNGETMTTTASGEVVFSNVAPGTGLPYSVSKTGFEPLAGSLSVASTDVTQSLALIPSTVTEPNPEPEPEPEPVAQLNPRNIFSPNGDGINEVWEVEGIEQQPELKVYIFNKYGQRVFQAQPYTNSWDGGGLPDGVYYYQVQNPEGKPVKKGAITLVR